tara:strand:- start:128 stop:247 length:120 start_codon:yes stop_codon:yes gene_type:complete
MSTNRLEAFTDGVLAIGGYVVITALWLIPDSRLEHALDG